MSKKIKVRLEDVDLILPVYNIISEEVDNALQRTSTKIGVFPNGFDEDNDHELLFEHEVDQRVYYWFTESEFKEVIDTLDNTSNLYPLDDGAFIYEMTNDNKPFEITLEESEDE